MPDFDQQSVTLINGVIDSLNKLINVNSLHTNPFIRNSIELHALLLYGSSRSTIEVNTHIFSAVHYYITESKLSESKLTTIPYTGETLILLH